MERLLRALPARPQSIAVRLGVTTVIVAVCFVAVTMLYRQAGLYWLFVLYPAIFIASLLFDRGSGLYATALSAVLFYVLAKPSDSLLLPAEYAVPIAIFVVIASALAAISEALRACWERAVAAEKTKDLLLRELGHRIRNNLAMAISIVMLQARAETSAEVKSALQRAAARIRAIAGAHEHLEPLYQDGRVEMRDYLATLCQHLREHLDGVRPIAIDVTADDTGLRAEDAIAMGLVVNELVTNAVKHAFPEGRGGAVRVALTAGPPLRLVVEDDGVGCPPQRSDGLGSKLLNLLVQQLRGTIDWEEARPGCRVWVTVAPRAAERLSAAR